MLPKQRGTLHRLLAQVYGFSISVGLSFLLSLSLFSFLYIYIHMASPIPATAYRGLVRPYGSQLLEFSPPLSPISVPNPQNGNKTDPNSGTIHDKSVLGSTLGPTWGAPGSKKAPDAKKYRKSAGKVRNGRSTGTPI